MFNSFIFWWYLDFFKICYSIDLRSSSRVVSKTYEGSVSYICYGSINKFYVPSVMSNWFNASCANYNGTDVSFYFNISLFFLFAIDFLVAILILNSFLSLSSKVFYFNNKFGIFSIIWLSFNLNYSYWSNSIIGSSIGNSLMRFGIGFKPGCSSMKLL